jgi:hypothetical protein
MSSNCLVAGTLVLMADGRKVPIELLRAGDRVATLAVAGLEVDAPYQAQYHWLSTWGLDGCTRTSAAVGSVRIGTHTGFVVINRRIKATPEHPFLVRRGDEHGFVSAELVREGDHLVAGDMSEERVESIERIDAPVQTVALQVPGTNTYLAEGVWTHNDLPTPRVNATLTTGGTSGTATGSDHNSMKTSGSSFTSDTGTIPGGGSGSGSGSGSGGSGHEAVRLTGSASAFIAGGLDGVPPAPWQQSGSGGGNVLINSGIEEA